MVLHQGKANRRKRSAPRGRRHGGRGPDVRDAAKHEGRAPRMAIAPASRASVIAGLPADGIAVAAAIVAASASAAGGLHRVPPRQVSVRDFARCRRHAGDGATPACVRGACTRPVWRRAEPVATKRTSSMCFICPGASMPAVTRRASTNRDARSTHHAARRRRTTPRSRCGSPYALRRPSVAARRPSRSSCRSRSRRNRPDRPS